MSEWVNEKIRQKDRKTDRENQCERYEQQEQQEWGAEIFQPAASIFDIDVLSSDPWHVCRDVTMRTLKYTFSGIQHEDTIFSVVYLADGRIASASKDHTIMIWERGVYMQTFIGHLASVNCIASYDTFMVSRMFSSNFSFYYFTGLWI